jgi:hypothetical protein
MGSSSKRQQTMAKRAREQAIRERRERKAEKKALRREQAANPDAAIAVDADMDADSAEPDEADEHGEPTEPLH